MSPLRWPSIVHHPLQSRVVLASIWAAEDKVRRLHHERARLRLPEILAGVFVFILLPYGLWWVA